MIEIDTKLTPQPKEKTTLANAEQVKALIEPIASKLASALGRSSDITFAQRQNDAASKVDSALNNPAITGKGLGAQTKAADLKRIFTQLSSALNTEEKRAFFGNIPQITHAVKQSVKGDDRRQAIIEALIPPAKEGDALAVSGRKKAVSLETPDLIRASFLKGEVKGLPASRAISRELNSRIIKGSESALLEVLSQNKKLPRGLKKGIRNELSRRQISNLPTEKLEKIADAKITRRFGSRVFRRRRLNPQEMQQNSHIRAARAELKIRNAEPVAASTKPAEELKKLNVPPAPPVEKKKAETAPATAPKPKLEPKPAPKPQLETKPEQKPELKPEPRLKPRPELEPKPAIHAKPKPQPAPAPKKQPAPELREKLPTPRWDWSKYKRDDLSSIEQGGHVSVGWSGGAVKETAALLSDLGYDVGKSVQTGKFKAEMDKAVREFQKANNLKVDGLLGKRTLAKLREITK